MTNALVGAIQALIVSAFGILQVFGVFTMTDDQRGAVLACYGAIAALVLLLNTYFGKPAEIRQAAKAQGVTFTG